MHAISIPDIFRSDLQSLQLDYCHILRRSPRVAQAQIITYRFVRNRILRPTSTETILRFAFQSQAAESHLLGTARQN